MTEIEIWTKWESQTVNGLFPLRRFLGRSNHSVVFLTECKAQNLAKAAIKLVPADAASGDAQLSHWKRIAALSHPNLIRLLDMGRCKLGGHPFLFVVMEYAEQTLAQILPHRPLTAQEARELLTPTLSALAYLHGKHLVQAQLKPPNFLVVNDQLKLAADTVRAAGEAWSSEAKPSVYDPPEGKTGTISAAGDVWALGVTLTEALTQHPPTWPNERSGTVLLPATTPPEFADTLRRCLSRHPANRPALSELEARLNPPLAQPPQVAEAARQPEALETAAPPVEALRGNEIPQVNDAPRISEPAPMEETSRVPLRPQVTRVPRAAGDRPQIPRWLAPAVAVGLLVLLIVWAATRPFGGRSTAPPVASAPIATPSQQSIPPAGAPPSPAPSTSTPSVIHEEVPVVSRGARGSIRGDIKVTVRVTVDRSGSVVAHAVENRGPSRYFARVAAEAAKKWRFTATDTPATRQWVLEFDFSRAGATVQAATRLTRPAS
jgi:serine/threonine protein kinase